MTEPKIEVQTVIDSKRGCGWRKAGGLYLRCDLPGFPCGKLPIPLDVCPCCHAGIKPSRGWTWFDPRPFVEARKCDLPACNMSCVPSDRKLTPERAGLLWIGEKFYHKPSDWLEEAARLGVSRRISAVPKDFKVGETWVFAAHRLCIALPAEEGKEPKFQAGIFHVFRPTRIEYVTSGKESQKKLQALVDRGITPVKVQREGELIAQKS